MRKLRDDYELSLPIFEKMLNSVAKLGDFIDVPTTTDDDL